MDIKCGIYLCIQIRIFILLAMLTDSSLETNCLNTTTCPCCKTGACPSDGSGQCGGNCLDGYYGDECWNRCPIYCTRCEYDQGLGGVVRCTQCEEGYYFTPTAYRCQWSCSSDCKTCANISSNCTACYSGYYVTSSNGCTECSTEKCSLCYRSGQCITCNIGYYLQENKCNWCDPNCDSCFSNDTCSCTNGCLNDKCMESGLCSFGCKHPQFTSSGDTPDKCDICETGLYGYECSRKCPQNCESTCDRPTGVCTSCRPGTFGDYCENQCPHSCNKTLGQCDSCLDGYYGNNCSMNCETNCKTCNMQDGQCMLCVEGLYGEDCNMNCSEHCIIQKCDRLDGRCDCKPGYGGDQCTLKVTTSTATSSTEILVAYAEESTNVVAVIGITVVVVAVLVLAVVAVVFAYRRFRRRPVSSGAARVDMVKLRVEIATIEAAIMATEQSSGDSGNNDTEDLQIRLKELQRKLLYYHSERADRLVTENTYEQLQRQRKDQAPYASMELGLVTTEDTSGGSGSHDKVEPNSEKAHRLVIEKTYEQLQRQKTNETPYASLRP